MEVFFFLFLAGLVLVSPVAAFLALIRGEQARRRLRDVEDELRALAARMGGGAAEAPQPTAARPPAPVRPAPLPPPMPPAVSGAFALAARSVKVPAARPPDSGGPARTAPPPSLPDFASTIGPRLLIATGAMACVVFLGLFVKYAWENNWVGPTGRVLLGGATGAVLMALGLRMLKGRYRPLGQGLAGAGLAGLYISAFGAHGFYNLIPREPAGLMMATITTSAVLLAARLDARLMAALAWVGGYLTPVLLSTGEDRAVALFLYLALLDAGALVLDRRRPWPETAPLAAAGTVMLYASWYGRFFTPARFGVAAFGIVLFTALFVVGMARRQRQGAAGLTVAVSTMALLFLAGGADRPAELMLLSLGLAAVGLALGHRLGAAAVVLGLFAVAVPFMAWGLAHYRDESFVIAAGWVIAGLLLLLSADPIARAVGRTGAEEATPASGALLGLAIGGAGVASAAMALQTDAPIGLSVFLLAQAGVAMLARTRWAWSELVAVAGAAMTATAWLGSYFKPGREGDAWLVVFPVAGVYLMSLVTRGLVLRRDVGVTDVMTHLANAAIVWGTLFHVLYDTAPGALALASIALAAVYLVLGLAALKERPEVGLQVRTWLGLAAVFVTLAIPVRLGLHGITLAWALEGVLLLSLGLRYRSLLARGGGYVVLGLAVIRLFARHAPPRPPGPFTPVFNAPFGTWVAVIVALALAVFLLRRRGIPHDLDRLAAGALAAGALLILFGLLTDETSNVFAQMARAALQQADAAGVEQARWRGRLALSVLWTLFGTGLLAGGLGLRNRPLFYAAYALFAATALKVVFVDLAALHTVYRMLSFLALGLLLLAGAYMNLRFRERLLPREAVP